MCENPAATISPSLSTISGKALGVHASSYRQGCERGCSSWTRPSTGPFVSTGLTPVNSTLPCCNTSVQFVALPGPVEGRGFTVQESRGFTVTKCAYVQNMANCGSSHDLPGLAKAGIGKKKLSTVSELPLALAAHRLFGAQSKLNGTVPQIKRALQARGLGTTGLKAEPVELLTFAVSRNGGEAVGQANLKSVQEYTAAIKAACADGGTGANGASASAGLNMPAMSSGLLGLPSSSTAPGSHSAVPVWWVHQDPFTGVSFYENRITKQRQWHPPTVF